MGASAALELARRGRSVRLLERFAPGLSRGSSHGPTRIFRLSYPDPGYVEMAVQALIDWRRLERDTQESLLSVTGGLDTGPGASACAAAMAEVGVPFEEIDAGQAAESFSLDLAEVSAIFQPDAAVIDCRKAIDLQIDLARQAGVSVEYGVRVASLLPRSDGSVELITSGGRIVASTVVLAAGPWARPLAMTFGLDLPLFVTLEQVAYLAPVRSGGPIVIDWTSPPRYLIPAFHGAHGMKVGLHHHGFLVDPEDGPFPPSKTGLASPVEWASRLLGQPLHVAAAETCLYTNTASEDFLIFGQDGIVVMSACSGHGFKFAPRLGRAVADLIDGLDPKLPEPRAVKQVAVQPE